MSLVTHLFYRQLLRARNLAIDDTDMNAFAQMKIGSSLTRTPTVPSTKNPEWPDSTFKFTEDVNNRFAKIEVRCEVPVSSSRVKDYSVGILELPLMPILDSQVYRRWYKLGYSGDGGSHGFEGEIEVEMFLDTSDPDAAAPRSFDGNGKGKDAGVFAPFRSFFEAVRGLPHLQVLLIYRLSSVNDSKWN